MEMNRFLLCFIVALTIASCSNSPELETGEIKTLTLIKQSFQKSKKPSQFIDAQILLSRKQIDAAGTPVLFVKLESGQNGTLTPYPGQGDGQTWLGADGATITLQKGVLKASRGMGDDLMGSSSSMPPWSKINKKTDSYIREIDHMTGNNQISKRIFSCNIEKTSSIELINVWDINFKVAKFEEHCFNSNFTFKNIYYVDSQGIVRRSSQYHSDTSGFIMIERLDQ